MFKPFGVFVASYDSLLVSILATSLLWLSVFLQAEYNKKGKGFKLKQCNVNSKTI